MTPAPTDPAQTVIYWSVSTLIFVLMVTLAFILVRTGVKLWIERRDGREGSRIKTKLVLGALALSFMPVFGGSGSADQGMTTGSTPVASAAPAAPTSILAPLPPRRASGLKTSSLDSANAAYASQPVTR